MKPERDTTKKSPESPERRKLEEYPANDPGAQHSLLQLQRQVGNRAVVSLLESSSTIPSVQLKAKNSSVLSPTGLRIQRAADNAGPPSIATSEAEPETSPTPSLIVEDDAASVAPAQMRKSEFLEQLRSAVCATADAALAEAGQSTEGCPYIEQWLSYYNDQPPAYIERALRRYAPDAAAATSAREYIPAVSNRVRQGIANWARTGELTDVPEELQGMLSGPGAALGAIGGLLGGIGSAIGGVFSSIGKALFKRKEGSAAASDDPQAIQAQLSDGQPLDGGTTSRLGQAFGADFSNVRVHTDAGAAGLSDSLNARAFTVGNDIAFGAGEYQPGTMIGDALIAHELAHVVQQSGGGPGSALQSKTDDGHDALEEDADLSAVGAVVSAWGGVKGALKDIGQHAMPRMRSGLRLQRCRRDTNVTAAEADTLIRGRYGDNLAAAIAAGTTAVGRVKVVNDAQFAANFKRIGGKAIDLPETAAFVDRTVNPPMVYIHETRQHPATVVHEALHLYQDNAMRTKVPSSVKEGITEYFTRQIVEQEYIVERTNYQDEYTAVNELAQLAGETVMRKAYFEGDVAGLEAAVDRASAAGNYHNWSVSMEAEDWRGAHTSLKFTASH